MIFFQHQINNCLHRHQISPCGQDGVQLTRQPEKVEYPISQTPKVGLVNFLFGLIEKCT